MPSTFQFQILEFLVFSHITNIPRFDFRKNLTKTKTIEKQQKMKNHQTNSIFQNFPGPGHFTFIEKMNSRIDPWFSFSLNLVAKIQMGETVKNELNTLNKKTPKIINRSIFSRPPTSCTLQPYYSFELPE